ncbi:MAG: hypothetical protein ACOC2Y_03055 [Spirochaetota bacterium]
MNRVQKVDEQLRVRRVLLSVSDKSGLESFVPRLTSHDDVIVYSTGGTYDRVSDILGRDAEERLRRVSDYTGQPEMQGGLVKTLDYRIYLGLLSEPYNDAHAADRERVGAELIDMVVVNLYPFRSVAARSGSDPEDARGNIDIGGPCMLRAAAKSYLRVAAVCDPADYESIADELDASGGSLGSETRFRLAQKAFGHTAQYDRAIADYLSERSYAEAIAPYEVNQ